MATYPLPTLAPIIDASGISTPSYNDIYQSLIASFQNIYGADVYVAPDSQDGQWLAVLAQAIYDSNLTAVMLFQSFSPSYAQGAQLSSLVKINGILRDVPTFSTSVGTVTGVAGTVILGGVVKDTSGNLWNLPATVSIPVGGSIAVTVTAQQAGNITIPAGQIDIIANPQLGWQSFVNTTDSIPGAPVESDAALRQRQTISVAMPALGIKEAIFAAVGNVPGVSRFTVYENDTGFTNSDGIPSHSISIVALGGTVAAITAAIASRKPPGIQTYGNTSNTVYDQYGLPVVINYFPLTLVRTYFAITIKALPGYVSTTGTAMVAALVAFVNSLAIGEDVYQAQAQASSSLIGLGLGQTFYITSFYLDIAPAPVSTANIVIAFNAAATLQGSDVTLTVT